MLLWRLLQVQFSTRDFWANSSLQSQGLAADTPWQQTRSSFGLVQVAPKHLHNVETHFYCPQTLLSVDIQCRDDIFELKQRFWD